jgi:hypothetical protein
MRKVLGEWLRQFTCPKCGGIGAGSPLILPLCHKCDYKVKMLPSHNGVIVPSWQTLHQKEREQIHAESTRSPS